MRAVFNELVGLFVDDGFLAVALVGWCAAIGLLSALLPSLLVVWGPILLAGCAAILLATILRTARRWP